MTKTYEASPIKRMRRTKADIEALKQALLAIVEEQKPMTVRQVYYQAVTRNLVDKTEAAYNNAVGRLLVKMRREGMLPYAWITDSTRWMHKSRSYGTMADALRHTARFYRRDLWTNMPVYVEVWIEKEALAGVVIDTTDEYDVPLMVGKGYASLSYLHSAAEHIAAQGKPAYLYFFGDHDPSGVDAVRAAQKTLWELAPNAEIHFEHCAVTWEQVERWNLPTRPTKKTDARAKKCGSRPSVELDAIHPDKLRGLVRECIERHIDVEKLNQLRWVEREERSFLATLAQEAAEERM